MRHILPIASFLVALGFQVSGYTNFRAAVVLWALAVVLFAGCSLPDIVRFAKRISITISLDGRRASRQPHDPATADAIRRELARLYNTWIPAYAEAESLINRILPRLRAGDASDTAVAILLERFVCDTETSARSTFETALFRTHHLPHSVAALQNIAGDFYEKYQWLTTWIAQAGELVDFHVTDGGSELWRHIAYWREHDKKLLAAIRDCLPDLPIFRDHVTRVGWGEGPRAALDKAALPTTADQVRAVQVRRMGYEETYTTIDAGQANQWTRPQIDQLPEAEKARLFDVHPELADWWLGKPTT